MAVLTAVQKDEARTWLAADNRCQLTYTKVQMDAALQAVENWLEANRVALSTAINTATAPLVLTAAQKRALVAIYLSIKFRMEV